MAEGTASSNMDKQNSLLAGLQATDAESSEALGDAVVDFVREMMEEERETGAGAPYCPIVYGSIAFKLKAPPKKPDEEEAPVARATHRWTREQDHAARALLCCGGCAMRHPPAQLPWPPLRSVPPRHSRGRHFVRHPGG